MEPESSCARNLGAGQERRGVWTAWLWENQHERLVVFRSERTRGALRPRAGSPCLRLSIVSSPCVLFLCTQLQSKAGKMEQARKEVLSPETPAKAETQRKPALAAQRERKLKSLTSMQPPFPCLGARRCTLEVWLKGQTDGTVTALLNRCPYLTQHSVKARGGVLSTTDT